MTELPAPPPAEWTWAFFLDVDGTLVPLASSPDAARLPPRASGIVRLLHSRTQGAVALVSGRAIADIDRIFGEPPLPVAGQHGAELRPRVTVSTLERGQDMALVPARATLGELVARHAGLLLEDKGLSIAVHYRHAPSLARTVHRAIQVELERLGDDYRMQRGNHVVELTAAGSDKGQAIATFMQDAPFRGRLPVFIGDDITDEDGFVHVNALGGHSIRVGAGPTVARFRLADPAAVVAWLDGPASRDRRYVPSVPAQ